MDAQAVLEEFAALLRTRFESGTFTTEDSVRYTFYAAALRHGVQPGEVILEYPHPAISGGEVDTLISAAQGRSAIALEFKYDRANPGGANQNRTQRAAAVFVDIFRLARIPGTTVQRRYFVYVTDEEMAGYFRNPANRLDAVFNAPVGSKVRITPQMYAQSAATFRNRVAQHECSCDVTSVLSRDLPSGVFLRSFEVGAA